MTCAPGPAGGTVKLANGATVEFDWLVLALGSGVNTFGIPGVKQHALPFVTYDDAVKVLLLWRALVSCSHHLGGVHTLNEHMLHQHCAPWCSTPRQPGCSASGRPRPAAIFRGGRRGRWLQRCGACSSGGRAAARARARQTHHQRCAHGPCWGWLQRCSKGGSVATLFGGRVGCNAVQSDAAALF